MGFGRLQVAGRECLYPGFGRCILTRCSDSVPQRTLPVGMGVPGTVPACLDACYNAGYHLGGVEYGG